MDMITRQRLERRAAILATAREMIADVGYEAVKVRDLAERCRVSVPTLYNQFGGKDGLLGAAIEDHFVGVMNGGALSRADSGFKRLLVIIDQCAQQLLTLSAYHQRLLEAFMSLESTTAVQQRIAVQLTEAIERELLTMRGERQLSAWAAPRLIAEQLTTACINASVLWSSGLFSDASLRPTMRFSTGLVLLGVVHGKSHTLLQARVRAAQKQLVRARAQMDASRNKQTRGIRHG
jgi:AcrR family transcriptional regulator